MNPKLHHVAISTPELERLKDFYCEMFGLREVGRFAWPRGTAEADAIVGLEDSEATLVYLRGENACIELFEYARPVPVPRDPNWRVCDHGITHICFEVIDVVAEHARLSQRGMEFKSAPVRTEALHAAYGYDPDRNVIELLEFVDPVGARASGLSLTDTSITRRRDVS